ncbi:MAG: HepT-like ribonuclease domain-containing protein [Candidatus Aminicenantaceae bacterium]
MNKTDKSKIIPHIRFIEKELEFLETYKKELDWKVYQSQREKRLEVERWTECIINAVLDTSKMMFTINREDVPETSRELLFKIGADIFKKEEEAVSFSELARIRNTLAHRYLDLRWKDIKRFFQIAEKFLPDFLGHMKKQIQKT